MTRKSVRDLVDIDSYLPPDSEQVWRGAFIAGHLDKISRCILLKKLNGNLRLQG